MLKGRTERYGLWRFVSSSLREAGVDKSELRLNFKPYHPDKPIKKASTDPPNFVELFFRLAYDTVVGHSISTPAGRLGACL